VTSGHVVNVTGSELLCSSYKLQAIWILRNKASPIARTRGIKTEHPLWPTHYIVPVLQGCLIGGLKQDKWIILRNS
jgi:hypothetical protein